MEKEKKLGPIYNGCSPLELPEEELNKIAKNFGFEITEDGLQKIKSPREKLTDLKAQLTSTDYQVIKCYEYSLAGLALPYDITALHEEREALRVQIRELEEE